MLQALPSFDDLVDDDDASADKSNNNNHNNTAQSTAMKCKVGGGGGGETKHRALLAKLPAPKHALDTFALQGRYEYCQTTNCSAAALTAKAK
jgi:hypothetical protein